MKHPKRLVIDTSIARSAGDTRSPVDSSSPESKDCCEILSFIREYCHSIVMTKEMKKEWDIHASKSARGWLRRMYSLQGKVTNIKIPSRRIRNKILGCCPKDRHDAVEKDTFLIEAAFYSDKIILSKDRRALTDFSKIAETVPEVARIYWLNPVGSFEDCRANLDTAKIDDARRLGPHRA